MGLFGKSKAEKELENSQKLLDAAKHGDVAAARAALDGGANRECKDNTVRPAARVRRPAERDAPPPYA